MALATAPARPARARQPSLMATLPLVIVATCAAQPGSARACRRALGHARAPVTRWARATSGDAPCATQQGMGRRACGGATSRQARAATHRGGLTSQATDLKRVAGQADTHAPYASGSCARAARCQARACTPASRRAAKPGLTSGKGSTSSKAPAPPTQAPTRSSRARYVVTVPPERSAVSAVTKPFAVWWLLRVRRRQSLGAPA